MYWNFRSGAGAFVVSASLLVPAVSAQEPPSPLWSLEDALSQVWSQHPDVRAACAERQTAEADLLDARVYPYNPAIELEGADRRGAEESTTDRGLNVSQTFEVGGQRGRRIAAARAALAEIDRSLLRRFREHRARIERAFVDALAAHARLQVAESDVELTRELLSFEEKRLDAGAGTALDVRLAETALGRAEREAFLAEAAYAESRSRLAEAVGRDPILAPAPVGDLDLVPTPPTPSKLEDLVSRALAQRSDLSALERAVETERRRLDLEISRVVPDLTASAFTAREEGDDILGVSIGIPLPFFNRNQGGIARARSHIERADAELATAGLQVRREVAAARALYESAARGYEALDALVVETLEESLELLEESFRAGEIGATEVLVLRRELVDGRREHVEAARDLRITRIDLNLATGDLDVPPIEEVCHALDE